MGLGFSIFFDASRKTSVAQKLRLIKGGFEIFRIADFRLGY
jgi:hypothetical protein